MRKIKFFKGDLRDKEFIDSVFQKVKRKRTLIDGVIHFARLKAVEESVNYPLEYLGNNLISWINLFKSIIKKIVS